MAEPIVNKIATSDTCKSEVTYLDEYCRVCSSRSSNVSDLFGPEKNIAENIFFCTGVRFKQKKDLPTHICDVCLSNLTVSCNFKSTCKKADKTFLSLRINPQIKVKHGRLILNNYNEDILVKQESDSECYLAEEVRKEAIKNGELQEGKVEGLEEAKVEGLDTEQDTETKNEVKETKKVKLKKNTSTPGGRGRPTKSGKPRRMRKFKFKQLCCETCDIKFKTKEETAAHKREFHKESETFVCEICGKMFAHRSSHYTHVKSHMPPQFACDLCDYITWHKYDLVKHIRIHYGVKKYQCEFCTAAYCNSSNLTSHIRRHHMHMRPHECKVCRRTFFDKTKLNIHVDSHLEIKRYECEICHACFTRRCYWKKHLLKQHDVRTPPMRPGRPKTNIVIGKCLMYNNEDVFGVSTKIIDTENV